jgi:hypothetical protein
VLSGGPHLERKTGPSSAPPSRVVEFRNAFLYNELDQPSLLAGVFVDRILGFKLSLVEFWLVQGFCIFG